MIARWVAIVALLTAAGLGDLWLHLHKPDHKYRLTVEVETPTGPAVGESVIAVRRDKVPFGGDDGDVSSRATPCLSISGEGATWSRCLHSADTLKSRTG